MVDLTQAGAALHPLRRLARLGIARRARRQVRAARPAGALLRGRRRRLLPHDGARDGGALRHQHRAAREQQHALNQEIPSSSATTTICATAPTSCGASGASTSRKWPKRWAARASVSRSPGRSRTRSGLRWAETTGRARRAQRRAGAGADGVVSGAVGYRAPQPAALTAARQTRYPVPVAQPASRTEHATAVAVFVSVILFSPGLLSHHDEHFASHDVTSE